MAPTKPQRKCCCRWATVLAPEASPRTCPGGDFCHRRDFFRVVFPTLTVRASDQARTPATPRRSRSAAVETQRPSHSPLASVRSRAWRRWTPAPGTRLLNVNPGLRAVCRKSDGSLSWLSTSFLFLCFVAAGWKMSNSEIIALVEDLESLGVKFTVVPRLDRTPGSIATASIACSPRGSRVRPRWRHRSSTDAVSASR